MMDKISTDSIEIGRRIRSLRLSCGLTQKALAEDAGLPVSYLSNIERGIKSASLSVIVSLSFALETTVDYIVYGSRDLLASPMVMELYSLLQDCTALEYGIILETLKSLKSALNDARTAH